MIAQKNASNIVAEELYKAEQENTRLREQLKGKEAEMEAFQDQFKKLEQDLEFKSQEIDFYKEKGDELM